MNKSNLLQFEVSNFRSIYKKQTLDLRDNGSARKVTALYGPNASGKTNIARAMSFMRQFIEGSTNANINKVPRDPFALFDYSSKNDSTFRMEFVHNGRHMDYSFALNDSGVASEALYEYKGASTRKTTIFERTNNHLNDNALRFGFGKKLLQTTRPESLLLTKARENNNQYANIVFDWLAMLNVLSGIANETRDFTLNVLKDNPKLVEDVVQLLKDADLWIRDIQLNDIYMPDEIYKQLPLNEEHKKAIDRHGVDVVTKHAIRDKGNKIVGYAGFSMDEHESEGTRRFFELSAPILHTLENGMTLYMDEFETGLHEDMCQLIVRLFKSEKTNKKGAQLIINTHNTSLMSAEDEETGERLIGRDNIIFVEKDNLGQTIVTPLSKKSVRENEAYEKRYRQGLYGAKPYITR